MFTSSQRKRIRAWRGRIYRQIKLSQATGLPYADIVRLAAVSPSQLQQDIFALAASGMKKGGFFVEFGAMDGKSFSNSYMLATDFGWTGILAEPGPSFHEALKLNRPDAAIESRCVWKRTGDMLTFNMVDDAREYSTIDMFSDRDGLAEVRSRGRQIEVETITLVDLLREHKAPKTIDYLSIDTEGSEFEILSAFDFDAYDIRVVTCEHNRTPDRERIFNLMDANGYRRVHEDLSAWDDWYVRA